MTKVKTFLAAFAPEYHVLVLSRLLADVNSVLDLGCGPNSIIKYFPHIKYKVGVDLHGPSLKKSKEKRIHDEYVNTNIENIGNIYGHKSFECVIAIDAIEHLEKSAATKLIEDMENIGQKLVIIQTTNGWLKQEKWEGNPNQQHKCCFVPREFVSRGYKVIGMDGPKKLRVDVEGNLMPVGPAKALISSVLDPFLRKKPELCFNFMAYKTLV